MKRLSQNIDFGTAGAIAITVGGLAQIVGETGQIGAVGGNRTHGRHGATLAGIAYSHGATCLATKALHGHGAVRLNAHIHTLTLEARVGHWQGGLHDA